MLELLRDTGIYPQDLFDDRDLNTSERRWWAIYTKARQEKALARDLLAYEVPFYLPLIPKYSVVRGRRMRSYLPLFGGYVFLFGDDDERVRSLKTNRISRILPVGDQDELARDLQQVQRLIASNAPLTIEQRLEAGRKVRIKGGPMRGFEGNVISRRGATRLLVAVNFLQQGASIEIDDFLLEPV